MMGKSWSVTAFSFGYLECDSIQLQVLCYDMLWMEMAHSFIKRDKMAMGKMRMSVRAMQKCMRVQCAMRACVQVRGLESLRRDFLLSSVAA